MSTKIEERHETTKQVPFGVDLMVKAPPVMQPDPPQTNTKCLTGAPPRQSTDTDD